MNVEELTILITNISKQLQCTSDQLIVTGKHAIGICTKGDLPWIIYTGRKAVLSVNKKFSVNLFKEKLNPDKRDRSYVSNGVRFTHAHDAMLFILEGSGNPFVGDRFISAKHIPVIPHLFRKIQYERKDIKTFMDYSGTYNVIDDLGKIILSCASDGVIRIFQKTNWIEFTDESVNILGYAIPYFYFKTEQ